LLPEGVDTEAAEAAQPTQAAEGAQPTQAAEAAPCTEAAVAARSEAAEEGAEAAAVYGLDPSGSADLSNLGLPFAVLALRRAGAELGAIVGWRRVFHDRPVGFWANVSSLTPLAGWGGE
jgi:hypothetical protein